VLATVAALLLAGLTAATPSAKVSYDDAVRVGKPVSITVTARRAASFRIVLRVSTQGRTQLLLSGKRAPKGGPLIDTATSACEGAAGSFYCSAAYEPLPPGTYTWTVRRVSGPLSPLALTIRW
jgi:hypothetical protein